MDLLFLAPHPFFQERGSPIAASFLLRALSERGENVDTLVYHEGSDFELPNISLYRIPSLPFIRRVPPGFSWKKVICDVLMFFTALRLVRRKRYQLVHAVEESVFIALLLKWTLKIPYVYDMDSRLSEQLVESQRLFVPIVGILRYLETLAIRNSLAVVPVSGNLLTVSDWQRTKKVVVLRDISLLESEGNVQIPDQANVPTDDLKLSLGIPSASLLMYVGNLQPYQGIDLLLEGFALTAELWSNAHLVIIGGREADITEYRAMAHDLGIDRRTHFLGPKPVKELANIFSQADILISPRIKGGNTPMKLYSYLHSGIASLVTNLATHTQIVTDDIALIADPSPEALSEGMLRLLRDDSLRASLGEAAKRFIERNHNYDTFQKTVNDLYDWIRSELSIRPIDKET